MNRRNTATACASLLFVCAIIFTGCIGKKKEEPKAKKVDSVELSIGPSDEPAKLLSEQECEIRTVETDAFQLFYRGKRLVLKIRKNSKVPMCYLCRKSGVDEDVIAIVLLDQPSSPSIATENVGELSLLIDTLQDKSLKLTVMDRDPNGFYEAYIVTASSVTLLDAKSYSKDVNELRTLASKFQLKIEKKVKD